MRKLCGIVGCCLLQVLFPSPQGLCAGLTYTNPIGGTIRMGDPFILLDQQQYYLYGTTAADGFLCWSSPDLLHWESHGYAYLRTSESWAHGMFWAPEVTRYQGKYYMVYSASGKERGSFRLCIAVSDKPQGPFVDLHAPWVDSDESCIDADLFFNDDGTPYLFFDKVGTIPGPKTTIYGNIYGVQLSADLSSAIGTPILCVKPDQPWEEPDPKFNSSCNEGAYVFKHNNTYYLTYSAGHYASQKYAIGYATATSPLGPWKKHTQPLLSSDLKLGVSGPGHSCLVPSPDGKELYIVYHAHADPKNPSSNRTVNIDRLKFTRKGQLVLHGPTRTPQPLPSAVKTVEKNK